VVKRFAVRADVLSSAAMPRDELVIQLIKIAIAIVVGSYFVWWSLEVLHRLPPR
jgi:hypothetical protein